MTFQTINPSNEEVIKEYKELDNGEIEKKIQSAHNAFKSWRRTPFSQRSQLMAKAAEVLEKRKEEYGRLMAIEMGKPVTQGISEAEKCAWVCRYYAENAGKFLKDEHVKTEMKNSFVSFQPIGAVLAIMPWNFPFWQVFRFAAPALMAGNAGLLKHSRNTMGCAVEIENVFREAGFPEGLFTNLVIGSDPVRYIIDHPLVAAVTLTGSTPVGSKVASQAGGKIKKTVMELGGSDAYIVLKDADLEKSAEISAGARLINSGESCIAAKRFIIEQAVYDEFTRLFVDRIKARKMGNPLESDVQVGPQARKDLRQDLHRQVEDSLRKGASLLLGGSLPEGKGYFYPPTVLADVKKGMAAFDEETFGPVAALIPAKNEQEAIEMANDSVFGLGAAVFTQDKEKGTRLAREELNAGACFVNSFVRSDPRLPFGGVKESGYGRELSEFGIKEFVNIKTVCVG